MRSKRLPEEAIKALEEIEELSRHKDPAIRAAALSREIAIRDYYQRLLEAEQCGFEKGYEEGLRLGREINVKIQAAKNMKSQGFSIEQIQSVTGLSREEIELL